MARIAIILGRLVVGGATINAVDTARYLQHQHDVLLVTGQAAIWEGKADYMLQGLDRVQHISLKGFHRTMLPWMHVKTCFHLKQILKEFKPDVVHTHTPVAGLLGRLAAASIGVHRIVHTYHGLLFIGYFPRWQNVLVLNLERWLASKSDRLVVLSKGQKDLLVHRYKIAPEKKVWVVPVGIDTQQFVDEAQKKRRSFRMEYLLENEELAIGIVGRLVPIKNHRLLLNAMASLLKEFKHVRLFIIGDGPLRHNIFQLCHQLGLDYTYFPEDSRRATVTFTSWNQSMPTVMAGIDLLALSSISEGAPLSVMEAMAAGKPVVSTNVGAIPEMIDQNWDGLIVPQNDLAAYADALRQLISNEEKRNALGQHAAEKADRRFASSAAMKELTKVLFE